MSLKEVLTSSRGVRRVALLTAAASVAVAGFTLTSASGVVVDSRCAAAQQVYLSATDPATASAVANYLTAAGCSIPSTSTTGATTTSSSSTSSTSSTTTSSTTSTSTTTTLPPANQAYCAGLNAALNVTTDPPTRAAIQQIIVAAGCKTSS